MNVEDCKYLSGLIIDLLEREGYNKKELKQVIDSGPYPKNTAYATLRFPISDKIIENKSKSSQHSDSDSEDNDSQNKKKSFNFRNKKAIVKGDLSRFILSSRARPIVDIKKSSFFDYDKPFPL